MTDHTTPDPARTVLALVDEHARVTRILAHVDGANALMQHVFEQYGDWLSEYADINDFNLMENGIYALLRDLRASQHRIDRAIKEALGIPLPPEPVCDDSDIPF